MMTSRKNAPRWAALTLATLTLVSLAGCAVDEEPTSNGSDPAQASGSITVACGGREDWCQAETQAFEQKTGIKTSYVRLSSGEAVARFQASKEQPEFDVFFGGPADGYGAAKDLGLLEKYVSPNAADIPAEYKDPEGYWTGVYVGALGFCSNPDILAELGAETPQTWDDLLDPKLKGQVMMAHPATSGTAYTALWTNVVLRGGEDGAIDYMKQLNSSILQYSKDGAAPGQAAARGEVATGVVFTHDCMKIREQGAPNLVITAPTDGTGYEVGGVALIANSQNPTAAKAYIDWALTAESQDIALTVNVFHGLTAPGTASDPRSTKLSEIKLVDYDFSAAAEAKPALIERFDNEVASESEATEAE